MKHLFLIFLSLYSLNTFAQSEITATWDAGDDNTLIEIIESESELVGKIKSSDNPKAQIGSIMLKDFKQKGDSWTAQLYSAKRKKWYDVEIQPKNELLELKISIGFMSKTLEWKKI